jgi:hypothetical protein
MYDDVSDCSSGADDDSSACALPVKRLGNVLHWNGEFLKQRTVDQDRMVPASLVQSGTAREPRPATRPAIAHLDDRSSLFLVDGDDDLGVRHAGEVLDREIPTAMQI